MSMSFYRWLLLSMAALFWTACSSDGQEDMAEPTEEKSQDDGDATAEDAAGEQAANEAVNEAAPSADDEAAAAIPDAPAPAAAEPPGFTGKPMSRYITSFALNVRSGPTKEAPVVRHVKWGDRVDVVINGEWAKLAPGEFISSKHLSTTAPGASKKAVKAKKGK